MVLAESQPRQNLQVSEGARRYFTKLLTPIICKSIYCMYTQLALFRSQGVFYDLHAQIHSVCY